MSVPGFFSYRQLTETQVQGSRDRAHRQVEYHQLVSRFEHVDQKWKEQLQNDCTSEDNAMYFEAVSKAFEKDNDNEVSPFTIARLAGLCRKEYQAIQLDKGLRRIHNDYRMLINWMYQQSEQCEKDIEQMKARKTSSVKDARRGLLQLEQRKIQELRESLEWKKRELLALRERILNKQSSGNQLIQEIKTATDTSRWVDRSDWVDIEDDSGPRAGSEWVLCS